MVKNTSFPVAASSSRVVTNDIYLAAFLLSKACLLVDVLGNGRRRVTFVFEGESAEELRAMYKADCACSFRDGLNRVREILHNHQRSIAHGPLQPAGDRATQE